MFLASAVVLVSSLHVADALAAELECMIRRGCRGYGSVQ